MKVGDGSAAKEQANHNIEQRHLTSSVKPKLDKTTARVWFCDAECQMTKPNLPRSPGEIQTLT